MGVHGRDGGSRTTSPRRRRRQRAPAALCRRVPRTAYRRRVLSYHNTGGRRLLHVVPTVGAPTHEYSRVDASSSACNAPPPRAAPEPRADGGVEEGGPGHHDARRVRRRALRVQQVAVQQIRTEPQCDAAPNAEPSGVRIRRQFRRRARALCEPARHAGQNERAHQCAAWRLGIAAAAGAAAAGSADAHLVEG